MTAVDQEVLARRVKRWGVWYVTEHQLRVILGYKGTVLATAIGTPFLYLFAFGVGLASLVSANLGPHAVSGVSYLTFVAPALICTATVTMAGGEFTFPIMQNFKWIPVYFGMHAAPLSPRQIMGGQVLFVAIRMAVAAIFYYLVMLVFGASPSPLGVAMIPVAVYCGLAFGLPLLAFSTWLTEETGQFSIINRVVVLPLALFSGTIFPLSQLPLALQWIGWISPLWHGTQLARGVSFGAVEPAWLIVVHVLVLLVDGIVGWLLAVRFATRKLTR